jgi:hypothetical protein
MRTFIVSLALLVLGTVGAYADCTGQFPAGYVCGNDAAAQASPHAIPAPPPKAGSNLTFAVATTGSDANPCTTLLPCLTIQHTANVAAGYNYQNLYFPTIQLADGTYNFANQGWSSDVIFPVIPSAATAFGGPYLKGNTTTPGNVILDFTGQNAGLAWNAVFETTWLVDGIHFKISEAPALLIQGPVNLYVNNPIEIETVSGGGVGTGIVNNGGGSIEFNSTVSVSGTSAAGDFAYFFICDSAIRNPDAVVGISISNGTLIFSSPITMGIFASLANGCSASLPTANITNPGNISGSGFLLLNYSSLSTDVDPPSFPGTAGFIDSTSSWSNSNVNGGDFDFTARQLSGAPTTADLIQQGWRVFKDTTQGPGLGISLMYNDAGTMVAVGKLGDATGSTTVAGFGTNSPAITGTAPYTWLKFLSSDGSTVWVPAYK